jgi:hypothetical protein
MLSMLPAHSSTASPAQAELRPWVFGFILAGVITIFFFPVLTGSATFFFRDYAIFSYPIAQHHREAFWAGRIPLWNPHNNLGSPFLAQWNTMVLYPLSLIYLLLPLPWSLSFFFLAHLWLAGMGMFYLARSWTKNSWAGGFAGIAFSFNGLTLSCLKWPNNIAALGWMPWVALAVLLLRENRRGALPRAAAIGAMQMLAGAPEIILLTWIFAIFQFLAASFQGLVCSSARMRKWGFGLFRNLDSKSSGFNHSTPDISPANATAKGLWRRELAQLGIVVALVAGLCAAQLLPFLDLLRHSQRDQGFAAAVWPMPIWGWANFLVPLFRTFPSYHHVAAQPGQYWISTYYPGLPALFLALICLLKARELRARICAVLCLLFLWLALGDAGGLYWLARKCLPLVSIMRFPIKFVVLPLFAMTLMSAFGFAWLCHLPAHKKKHGADLTTRVGLLLILGIVGVACFAPIWPHPYEGWAITLDNGLARAGFCALTIVAAGVALRASPPGAARSFLLFLSLAPLLVLDVRTHAPWQNPTVDPAVYSEPLKRFSSQPSLGESRAMISPAALLRLDRQIINNPEKDVRQSRQFLFCNCNLIDGIPKVDGFFALELREPARVISRLLASAGAEHPPLMRFLSVNHITTSSKPIAWTNQPNALPWVVAGQMPLLTNAFEALFSSDWDPEKTVFLDVGTSATYPKLPQMAAPEAKVTGLSVEEEQVSFQINSPKPAMATHNQAWSGNWRARIDGVPAPLLRANAAFQAVAVPAGSHRVDLIYVDRFFNIGAVISGISIGILCCLFYKERR